MHKMRKGLLLFVVTFLMAMVVATSMTSCAGNGATKNSPKKTDSTSVVEDTTHVDSLTALIEEEEMPESADELFDDFFFNYSGSRKVQRDRTIFPLVVNNNGKESKISRQDWHHEHFFMEEGYYTLISPDQSELSLAKDTTVSDVTVEKLALAKGEVTRWHFARQHGLWFMNGKTVERLGQHPDAQFLTFYQKFATDSVYQQHSLANPIDFTGPDPDDDFANMTGSIMPAQWPMFSPQFPSGTLFNIIYGEMDKQKYATNTRYFYIRGIANGLQTDITFQKMGGRWVLKKITM